MSGSDESPSRPPWRLLNLHKLACRCFWASEYPELKYSCILNQICIEKEPFLFRYKHIESFLQEGPTCGLAAISILLQRRISPSELLNIAKDNSYSNYGELFSVEFADKLLQSAVSRLEDLNIKSKVLQKNLFSPDVIAMLLNGYLALVPYDSDHNHSPCEKNGHNAHWAVITGIIIVSEPTIGNAYHADDVYVTAKQGKSLHVSVWNLKTLEKSNQNLNEFSPQLEDDDLDYVIPDCGFAGDQGLKGQFIIIHPF